MSGEPPGCARPRLMRKRPPDDVPVAASGVVLFRLGEACDNDCPMCSCSGRPELATHATEELLQRVDRLAGWGVRRVVVTGGEPTVHPGFRTILERLVERRIGWDLNTNGRAFADVGLARQASGLGMRRVIVSFHSQRLETARILAGADDDSAHRQVIDGIHNLRLAGAELTLNCVLNRLNLGELDDFVERCEATFGRGYRLKLAFPYTGGRGGGWAPLRLRYREVVPHLPRLRDQADRCGIELSFESFPCCILGDPEAPDLSRSAFGETHYLDDERGDRLYSMRAIEASLSVFPETCRDCRALPRCPGVSNEYAERFGFDELEPF